MVWKLIIEVVPAEAMAQRHQLLKASQAGLCDRFLRNAVLPRLSLRRTD
jgi:hypothetical protein